MEISTDENLKHSTISSNVIDQNHDSLDSNILSHGDMDSKHEVSDEEIRVVLKVIAATGKFWIEWDKLKNMLSFYLKKVLSEYQEAKMTVEQQNAIVGETYMDLVRRLDDALCSFIEGPPFTLQRLCEILLDTRTIYPNLSKLALALEKNLSVTSMLTISFDPYQPVTASISDEPERETENLHLQSNSMQNGIESRVGDRDEIMEEVEGDVADAMTIDVETFEETFNSSETNPKESVGS